MPRRASSQKVQVILAFLVGLLMGMLPRLYALVRYVVMALTEGDWLNDWLTHL